ncbi:MAG: hypothetical protein DRH21_05725 [Deltaproteobacteria bacterium]|nr:MAG: hypothetical protein DRH21_05725 [Deltaproteobacteria bacterium]
MACNLNPASARHIKNVPGRKTDIRDSKWLAGLLRHGLLSSDNIFEMGHRPPRTKPRCCPRPYNRLYRGL